MSIPASAVALSQISEPLLFAPRSHGNTGLARETDDLGLAEMTFDIAPARVTSELAEINRTLKVAAIGLQFEIDKDTGKILAKVVDIGSSAVIREIPSEEVAQISKALNRLLSLLLHQTILRKWVDSRKPLAN